MPSRSELGKHIKRILASIKGRILIKVDYSAHEVRCFDLDSYVCTEIGKMRFRELLGLDKKPKVYSFNHETQEKELKEVGTQSVHETEEEMYKIEYEGGSISVTGNHPVWSVTRNAYIRADDIQEDEEIMVDA